MATRWGICGAGKISYDFCLCLRSLPREEHEIVAVAARDKGRAEEFATRFEVGQSYGSYEELAQNPNIDVVYIGTIHTQHVENSLLFINAGKNVLCEKPMALSLEGCKKVLTAAKQKGVFFAEAFWSRHFPAYKFIQEQIKSGQIGEVVLVEATFAVPILHVPRLFDLELGGGGLMDIGCYTVQAANLIFKGKPELIVAHGSKAESGADKTAVILLKYPGEKFATLAYSTEGSQGANHFTIHGTKGNLVIPDSFWYPTRVVVRENDVKYFQLPSIEDLEGSTFGNAQGFVYQAKCIRQCLLKGEKECEAIPHEDSETIMYIMEEALKQLGITAVAARNKGRAEKFAVDFDIPQNYGSYEELSMDPNVDVIYVATIGPMHVEASLLFINAGKNVLCEKPMALTLADCKKVLSAAKEKGTLFVEAYWSRFFPVYKLIQDEIKAGTIGEVMLAEATFAMLIPTIDKINDPEIGGGALLDLACYTVLAANTVFKGRPDRIIAEGTRKSGGDDRAGVVLLKYPGNKFASLAYSVEVNNGPSSFIIRGTKGSLQIPDFFMAPDRIILANGETKVFDLPQVKNHENLRYPNSQGLTYEAQGIRRSLLSGLTESPEVPHEDSETIMYILQEVLKQYALP
ncbi:unnamed protein product [Lymnaea stagnalis]|uniref:Trans-1,2-dihydrobenzene-1,2-diol dehydrogenase n=1 Tax=Lymnaea stagnalis TaxID=6523 RepID=A0AAV2IJ68_LYMST